MTLRITVRDLETGDTDSAEITEGDYLLICHDPCALTHAEPDGSTHKLTITGYAPRDTEGDNPQ